MSRYDLEQLIKLWAQEQTTPEQAIGQILLHLRDLVERIGKLERTARARPLDATPGAPSE
jgi:hypothetical protein